MTEKPIRLLVAASGTGGHLFPAIATAQQLSDYQIEWLGVSDRLETELVPKQYPLHTIEIEGLQKKLGLGTIRILTQFFQSILTVRKLLKEEQFDGVLTTGGYIAAPAIIAARTLKLPAILHESNALPGKVTRWLSPWCSAVALGFEAASQYLPKAKNVFVGTPVRSDFLATTPSENTLDDLDLPANIPVIVVVGGSQGAVSVNQLIRQCAPIWLGEGAWIVHLTGNSDPEVSHFSHPHYITKPFYQNMAGLLKRANLAISRAGAGTLTELAVTQTPSILIPYPYAAEDHQAHNAAIFAAAGAAMVFRQSELTQKVLQEKVLQLLRSPERLQQMQEAAARLASTDSAERLAELVEKFLTC